jgi:hypothetical protein
LTADELRDVVSAAADRHADVERQVRLIAARGTGSLAQLRSEVDRGLRTRRFLDYGESAGWAHAGRPIVAELENAVEAAPSRELVELLQRAVGHVVKVITHADDSDGLIGDLARELLALHARACDAGVADPVELAAWMVRFGFDDQDFFEVDPVRYQSALGEAGLAAYRDAVGARRDGGSFAVRYASALRKPGCPRTATPSTHGGTASRSPSAMGNPGKSPRRRTSGAHAVVR